MKTLLAALLACLFATSASATPAASAPATADAKPAAAAAAKTFDVDAKTAAAITAAKRSPNYKAELQKDPVGYFKRRGITNVPDATAKKWAADIDKIDVKPGKYSIDDGAAVAPQKQ